MNNSTVKKFLLVACAFLATTTANAQFRRGVDLELPPVPAELNGSCHARVILHYGEPAGTSTASLVSSMENLAKKIAAFRKCEIVDTWKNKGSAANAHEDGAVRKEIADVHMVIYMRASSNYWPEYGSGYFYAQVFERIKNPGPIYIGKIHETIYEPIHAPFPGGKSCLNRNTFGVCVNLAVEEVIKKIGNDMQRAFTWCPVEGTNQPMYDMNDPNVVCPNFFYPSVES